MKNLTEMTLQMILDIVDTDQDPAAAIRALRPLIHLAMKGGPPAEVEPEAITRWPKAGKGWSDEDEALLRDSFPTRYSNRAWIEDAFGRPYASVAQHASLLGIIWARKRKRQ